MGAEWKATAPYVTLEFDNIESTGKVIYEGFVNYIDALQKCVTEQLPTVLESAEALPGEAEEAKARAEGEFDALGLM